MPEFEEKFASHCSSQLLSAEITSGLLAAKLHSGNDECLWFTDEETEA